MALKKNMSKELILCLWLYFDRNSDHFLTDNSDDVMIRNSKL